MNEYYVAAGFIPNDLGVGSTGSNIYYIPGGWPPDDLPEDTVVTSRPFAKSAISISVGIGIGR